MGRHALIFCACALSACHGARCGDGTVETMTADGLQCVVDGDAGVPCDVDAGDVEIVAGQCVSKTKCDPGGIYDPDTGRCIYDVHDCSSAVCPNPVPAGKVCVTGGVVDFETGEVQCSKPTRPLRIAMFDAEGSPTSVPLAEEVATTKGMFTFVVDVPPSGRIAVGVTDPVGIAAAAPLAWAFTTAVVVPGTKYNLDAYLVPQSTLDGWAAADARFASAGSYVGCFYQQPPPAPTNLRFTETMPAPGVQLVDNGGAPSLVRYLTAGWVIDPMLTATGSIGCAVMIGDGSVHPISGTGGGVAKWETKLDSTAPKTVFIQRFHDCDGQPPTGACQ